MPPVALSFAGHSHFGIVTAMGVWIAIVFALIARWTHASRRRILAAIAGGLVAGAVNLATDSAAHAAGFWRYTEVTTPFGPLLYYVEAGIGCGALGILIEWLRRRYGTRAAVAFLASLAVYAPFRDWATARLTGLLDFHYEPFVVVVIADALSSFVIPVVVAWGVVVGFSSSDTRAA